MIDGGHSRISFISFVFRLSGASGGGTPTTKNVWQGLSMIPCIMEDILKFVSVRSVPAGLGQLVGVDFWACLAGVPHQPKCLARSIHDTRYYGGHFGVGFSSSLPAGLGQLVGVAFWACLAGVPHHPKCPARSIHNTWGCKEHLVICFVPFAFLLT